MDVQRILEQIRPSYSDRDVYSLSLDQLESVPPKDHPGAELIGSALIKQLTSSPDAPRTLPARVNRSYAERAMASPSMAAVVVPRSAEFGATDGVITPSGQHHFQVAPGIIHKYLETVQLSVCRICSSTCRSCYRRDLLTGHAGTGIANADDAASYIRSFNRRCALGEFGAGAGGIASALLTGGDPMVMENRALFRYLFAIAATGIKSIRIGTKELAFFPRRFDAAFASALDVFHQEFPGVRLSFILHFSHPDEFAAASTPCDGGVIENWSADTLAALDRLQRRNAFISLYNQSEIIADVNDDASVLGSLQSSLAQKGISNYYFFQCRPIVGADAFAVPVERTLQLIEESQQRLTGTAVQARFVMSTMIGKVEVIGLNRGSGPQASPTIVFRLIRAPFSSPARRGALITARSNPDAIWISDYLDRIVSDDTEQLSFVDPRDL